MAKSLPLFLILMLAVITGYAQNTRGGLEVTHEAANQLAATLTIIKQAQQDTNRVNALNKAAHIYWYNRTINNQAADSTFLFASQALTISKDLHFTEGANEALFMMCKVFLEKNDVQQALKLTNTVYGEECARLLLIIAEPYVFHFPPNSKEFLQALPLINRAKDISAKYHSVKWAGECLLLLGKYYFRQGNSLAGKEAIMEVINTYHRLKNQEREARFWSALGTYMPDDSINYETIRYSHTMAVKYYLAANYKKEAGYSWRDLALLDITHSQYSKADNDFKQMLATFKAVNEKLSVRTYIALSTFYRVTGRNNDALYYALEAIKTPEPNRAKVMPAYEELGIIYESLGNFQNSVKYWQIVFEFFKERNDEDMFYAAYQIANNFSATGSPRKALFFLTDFLKKHPLPTYNYKQLYASCFGGLYFKLGDIQKAEQYYLQMLGYEKDVEAENASRPLAPITVMGNGANLIMGGFYVQRQQWLKAKYYLGKSLTYTQYSDINQHLDAYLLLFKADSALGNYVAAIKNFERHKILFDSINDVKKSRQIAELNIKYETAQKAKDIKLLENKQKLQQAAIQRANYIKDFILGVTALLSLLAASLYLGYRNKQRSNSKLQLQQEEINTQNVILNSLLLEKDQFLTEKDVLIEEKDGLLKEKDWLLKEVHHRVKNNLQIIMSLLRTQLAHLKTDDAKGAIIESENRVQAIALIHQKLYHSDKLASISMPSYVSELVNYLSDGLDARDKKVRFYQLIDAIDVDLAQAVPLGLILNEAITNAIKYGVKDSGVDISIKFCSQNGADTIMTIADNGNGLPANFDPLTTKSLGMQMMKGLSRQLKGTFEITSNGGVTVTVRFKLIPVFSAV